MKWGKTAVILILLDFIHHLNGNKDSHPASLCSHWQELSSLQQLLQVWLLLYCNSLSTKYFALEISHLLQQWNEKDLYDLDFLQITIKLQNNQAHFSPVKKNKKHTLFISSCIVHVLGMGDAFSVLRFSNNTAFDLVPSSA